jgi:hypothetical protein
MLPTHLCHYYDCTRGPFRSLSDLPADEAEAVLENIRRRGAGFASQRSADYLTIRRGLESRVRTLFIAKGGQPQRPTPHYMILGQCAWVQSWYATGCELCIPLAAFAPQHVSFTYGDTFPAMRYGDGKPYRGQVYTLAELPELIDQFGLPQVWNADGQHGPDRYIEAQVWDDAVIQAWLANKKSDPL